MQNRRAFTLVELLVVIGIIALLIAILMPALTKAKQFAQRTSCAEKLQQMMLAAQIHALEHKGFYPLAGVLPGMQPPDFDDQNAFKYSYLSFPFFGETRMIAPITVALASEMSYGNGILAKSNDAIGAAETDGASFIRNFMCPSQATSLSDLNQTYSNVGGVPYPPLLYLGVDPTTLNRIYYTEAQSYIYNEGVVGWGQLHADPSGRFRGRLSAIHQITKTMFAADGLSGSIYRTDMPFRPSPPQGIFTVYNQVGSGDIPYNPTCTLADVYNGNHAGDYANFDKIRHRGKINIGFCDGHVETRNITPQELISVYVIAP